MRGTQVPVAYDFFPNAAPGQKILEAPHNLIYLSVTVDVISTLSVWLSDQHGKLLDLRGEELTCVFLFVNASSMYVQYKVNVSENQVGTLKDAIRLRKGATLGFPKSDIRGYHVLLLTSDNECKLHWMFSRCIGITRSSCYTTRCSCTTYNLVRTYNWPTFWWY